MGGPFAWAIQFVVNLWFTYAQCDRGGRWQLPVHAWEIGLSVGALAIGLAAMWICVWIYRRTSSIEGMTETVRRGFGGEPPVARIHFLSVVGLTVNFLSLAIIVMTGIGAPLLVFCQQS
jgi:hypothetical protein